MRRSTTSTTQASGQSLRSTTTRLFLLALFALSSLSSLSSMALVACGPGEPCEAKDTKACTCADGRAGTQRCKESGEGFQDCDCGSGGGEGSSEPKGEGPSGDAGSQDQGPDQTKTPDTPNERTDQTDSGGADEPQPEPQPEPVPEPRPEPRPEPTSDNNPDEPTQPDSAPDRQAPDSQGGDGQGCGANSIRWMGQCTSARDYCTQRFSAEEQKKMYTPYTLIKVSNTQVFCQTKKGFYYLPGNGYGTCDADKDGWITIEAYRAVVHVEKLVQDQARCQLLEIDGFVYHADMPGAKPQLQRVAKKVPLIETFRNDGQGKLIERPVYTDKQAPLPKTTGNACQADADCTNQLCYRGHCVTGRRFAAGEINTLTKGCVAGLDLNDNRLDDASESPTDIPTPKSEFLPLLAGGYFMELHHGYFQTDFNNKGQKLPVYHIVERKRRGSGAQALKLKCAEASKGDTTDHWRACTLRDDQQCPDPQTQQPRKGLSHCWLKHIKQATPSLFKCVTYKSGTHFAPGEYGYKKRYSRPICKAKTSLNPNDPTKRDVQFECTKDEGKHAPQASLDEVGWACASFKDYQSPGAYLAGCIQECTEAKTGAGGLALCGTNDICQLQSESYGRGTFACASGQKGGCADGTNTCDWGKLTTCQPNATPKTEVCNNIDDDCNGTVDDGIPAKACWTGTQSTRGVGTCRDGAEVCTGGKLTCVREVKPTPEVCDGDDNDCNGKTDNGCPLSLSIKSTGGKSYTVFGTSGGATKILGCAGGKVLVGVRFATSGQNEYLAARCGTLQVKEERTKKPYTYVVTVINIVTGGGYGHSINTRTNFDCPQNKVVVGVETTGSIGFRLLCASYRFSGKPGSITPVYTTPTQGTLIRKFISSPKPKTTCPQGSIIPVLTTGWHERIIFGRRESNLARMGILCQPLSLKTK